MSNIPAAARYGIIAMMLVYAVFALRSAMHMTNGPGLTASIFQGVAATYALAAMWSMLRGGRGLTETVLALLALNLGAAAWLVSGIAIEASAFNARLILAVVFEGTVVWIVILGIILLLTRGMPTEQASQFPDTPE
jgi:carbon starvation protein CstA